MKLYEFMGKELMRQFGIPIPRGQVINSPEEALKVADELGSVVIKSQILSGKRGKAGGIKFAQTAGEAKAASAALLGKELNQATIHQVLVEEKLKIDQELYLAILMENSIRQPIILASNQGGMDIEEVSEEYIVKMPINIQIGVQDYLGREIARRLGLQGEIANNFTVLLKNLYQMFLSTDAELIEINPLVISGNKMIAADAKVTIDDDALFRQQYLPKTEEKTEAEKQAQTIGLSFVQLDGDIAIMANGAGITMATLDVIQHYGGSPANFLDAGGGASVEQTAKALEILLMTNPKVIFINIFGGITRCDDVAKAFLQVKKSQVINVPVIIRLVGTNEKEGIKLLKEYGIGAYKTMQDAAVKVVALAKGEIS